MPLDDMDGMANVQFDTLAELVWGTAADWDSATSESNVEHSSGVISLIPSITDGFGYLTSGENVDGQQGWVVGDGSAFGDDGTTNNATFTNGSINLRYISGITKGATYKDFGSGTPSEVRMTVGVDGQGDNNPMYQGPGNRGSPAAIAQIDCKDQGDAQNGDLIVNDTTIISGGLGDGVSADVVLSNIDYDAQTFDLNVDSTDEGQFNFWDTVNDCDSYILWAPSGDGKAMLDNLEVIYGEGSLTTDTKVMSAPSSPSLENLTYTLDSETIEVDVIGSPGTASEEVVTQTLDGSSTYALSWSSSHTDFRVRVRFSASDPQSNNPTFSSVTLQA